MRIQSPLLVATALIGLELLTATVARAEKPITVSASKLKLDDTGFYLDKGKWAAVNPEKPMMPVSRLIRPPRHLMTTGSP